MKVGILFFILFMVMSVSSYSQSALKGSHERTKSSLFRKKHHKQMSHFDEKGKDLLLKDNGTSYRRDRKLRYIVDADGFDMPNQGRRNKKKTK